MNPKVIISIVVLCLGMLIGCQRKMGEFGWHEVRPERPVEYLIRRDYTSEKLQRLQKESDQGSATASMQLYWYYLPGTSTYDKDRARYFLNISAAQGDARALNLLQNAE